MEDKEIQKEIEKIKERNSRVELDKKWETSLTRKITIMLITYIIVLTYSFVIKSVNNIFLSSLIPVFGYILSTLPLKIIRKIWENKRKK